MGVNIYIATTKIGNFVPTDLSTCNYFAPCGVISKENQPTLIMKRAIILLVALCLGSMAYAQQNNEQSLVQVVGYSEVELSPDLFTLSIRITERDSKGKISVESQTREMIKALKGAGIDTDKDLSLSNNSIDYYRRGTSLATTLYELKLHSTTELNAAFRALEPLGLSEVEITSATYSRIEELRGELRRKAIINARDKAKELAEAIGQGIGSCTQINDHNGNLSFNATRALKSARANSYGDMVVEEACNIEFRSEKLSYSLSATFELLPLEK